MDEGIKDDDDNTSVLYDLPRRSSWMGLIDKLRKREKTLQSLKQKLKLRSSRSKTNRSHLQGELKDCKKVLECLRSNLESRLQYVNLNYDDCFWVIYEENDGFTKNENLLILEKTIGKLARRPDETMQVPVKVIRKQGVYVGYVYIATLWPDFVEILSAPLPPGTTTTTTVPQLRFSVARRGFVKSRIQTLDGPFGALLDRIADHLRGPDSCDSNRRSILLDQHCVVKPHHLSKTWRELIN